MDIPPSPNNSLNTQQPTPSPKPRRTKLVTNIIGTALLLLGLAAMFLGDASIIHQPNLINIYWAFAALMIIIGLITTVVKKIKHRPLAIGIRMIIWGIIIIAIPILLTFAGLPRAVTAYYGKMTCHGDFKQWMQAGCTVDNRWMCVINYSDADRSCTSSGQCQGGCGYESTGTPPQCKTSNYPCNCWVSVEDAGISQGLTSIVCP